MRVTECGMKGKFYYPAATQTLTSEGKLDETKDITENFAMDTPIDCNKPDAVSFQSSSAPRGWYILFRAIENDSGSKYNTITVSYDDSAATTSTVVGVPSSRSITIKAVNDVPVFSVPVIGTDTRKNIYSAQPLVVLLSKQDQFFGLQVADVDAVTEDGNSEFNEMHFQLAITSIKLKGDKTAETGTVTYNVASTTTSGAPEITKVQPTADDFGFIQFRSSVSQANEVFNRISLKFNEVGTYTFEVVALDGGMTGYCPPGIVVDTDGVYFADDIRNTQFRNGTLVDGAEYRCNTVSAVTFTVQAEANTLVTAGAATGVGAGAIALGALAAVAFAKLRKPKDLDAWQALDGAMGGNAMSSGIHVAAGTSGQSALYSGK